MRKSFIKIFASIIITVLITTSIFFYLLVPTEYCAADGGSYYYDTKLYSIFVNNPRWDLYPDAERYISIRIFPFIDLRIPID